MFNVWEIYITPAQNSDVDEIKKKLNHVDLRILMCFCIQKNRKNNILCDLVHLSYVLIGLKTPDLFFIFKI